MTTVTKMDVDYIDGMNRCVNCGQRAGIDMAGNGEGFYVHDRTGLVQCGEFEFVSSSPAWFVDTH